MLSPAMNKLDIIPKKQLPTKFFHTKENSAQACCSEYIIYDPKVNRAVRKISSPVLFSAPVMLMDCISVFSIVNVHAEHGNKDTISIS